MLKASELILLTNNNQTLWVRRAESTSSGRYTCQAENSLGKVSRNFIVKVTGFIIKKFKKNFLGPPEIDLSPTGLSMEEINLLVGEHSILQCRVINQNMDANKIHIKWLINGKSVEGQNISSSIKVN